MTRVLAIGVRVDARSAAADHPAKRAICGEWCLIAGSLFSREGARMLDLARSHALAGACLAVGLIGAASAEAAPRVTGVSLDRGAVTGREVKLRVRAVDPKAPVNGLVVTFGRPSGVVGSSACRPPDSRGRAPGRPVHGRGPGHPAGAPDLPRGRGRCQCSPGSTRAAAPAGQHLPAGGRDADPPGRADQAAGRGHAGGQAEPASRRRRSRWRTAGPTLPGLPPLVAASRAVAFAAAATKCKNARDAGGPVAALAPHRSPGAGLPAQRVPAPDGAAAPAREPAADQRRGRPLALDGQASLLLSLRPRAGSTSRRA